MVMLCDILPYSQRPDPVWVGPLATLISYSSTLIWHRIEQSSCVPRRCQFFSDLSPQLTSAWYTAGAPRSHVTLFLPFARMPRSSATFHISQAIDAPQLAQPVGWAAVRIYLMRIVHAVDLAYRAHCAH